ncbi:ORC-CDC6 family AAA ATPase [Microbacterium aurum]
MIRNPFDVTKAVDFTDEEIQDRYVRYNKSQYSIVDPRSAVTQYLVGGKGGGRTHLMRYYSYPLQKSRAANGVFHQIVQDGYLGVYAPSSGLDGNRFAGAKIEPSAWAAVFAFSIELWLTTLFLDALSDIQKLDGPWTPEEIAEFTAGIRHLLGNAQDTADVVEDGMSSLLDQIRSTKHVVDRAVNNAPLTRDISLDISFSPGSLLFGAGRLASRLAGMSAVRITYMLDELENLTLDQQRFVNTLIREKHLPTSFLIGSRIYGVRTFETYSAGEENKKGSEYDWIVPEDAYSENPKSYREFCEEMVVTRLREAGLSEDRASTWPQRLDGSERSQLRTAELLEAIGKGDPLERKYLKRLRESVRQATQDPAAAEFTARAMSFPEEPLVEKLGILRLFQIWSGEKRIDEEVVRRARAFVEPLAVGSSATKELENFLGLWRLDMVAQIFADYRTELPYSGFGTYVTMSGYLPRSLLVTLKNISVRAAWRGERPFEGASPISVAAQTSAVRDASEWYFEDVRPMGELGVQCDHAVRRLGGLLHDVRYSDKPTEVSVTSFSSSLENIGDDTRRVIETCVSHRLLLEINQGRDARNGGELHRKFQIHPMLAPLFGLGFGRRGDLTLTSEEVSAIFDPGVNEKDFQSVAKRRVASMRAPFAVSGSEALFDLT